MDPVSCKQQVQDGAVVWDYQQHIWTVYGKHRDSSLPLVDFHHLLCQSSQEVALVHFQGADIQHRQVSWHLLQQGTTSSIPELWEGQTKSRTAGLSPPTHNRPSSLQRRFPQFIRRTLPLVPHAAWLSLTDLQHNVTLTTLSDSTHEVSGSLLSIFCIWAAFSYKGQPFSSSPPLLKSLHPSPTALTTLTIPLSLSHHSEGPAVPLCPTPFPWGTTGAYVPFDGWGPRALAKTGSPTLSGNYTFPSSTTNCAWQHNSHQITLMLWLTSLLS